MIAGGVRLTVCRAESLDPRINLATEACLTRNVGEGEIILFLWQNAHTAVIGRNQIARAEVALSRLYADGGLVIRRLSGGGAVYHDIGNLNYSFIYRRSLFGETGADNQTAAVATSPTSQTASPTSQTASPTSQTASPTLAAADRRGINTADASCDPIISVVLSALSSLGINAAPSGRNDITVSAAVPSADTDRIPGGATGMSSDYTYKISGGALYDLGSDGGICRHGTLLVAADLDAMSRYLTPSRAKLDCRGIASVRARVANLRDILPGLTTADVADALADAAAAKWGAPRAVSPTSVAAMPTFFAELERFSSDEWNLSDLCDLTDEWSVRFGGGTLTLSLSVAGGVIRDARLSTDALDAHRFAPVCTAVGAALVGVLFDPRHVTRAITECLSSDDTGASTSLLSMIRDNF